MGVTYEGNDPGRLDDDARTAGFHTVMALAEALREEFGVSIDAHPGGVGAEAGAVNRAFLAAARIILGGVMSSGDDPAEVRRYGGRRWAGPGAY